METDVRPETLLPRDRPRGLGHCAAMGFLLVLALMACSAMDENREAPRPEAASLGFVLNMASLQSGYPAELGARLAVAEINAQGGVNGAPLQLLVTSERSGSPAGMVGTRTLVDAGAVTILGGPTSGLTLEMGEVSIPAGIPLLSFAATSASLSTWTRGGIPIAGDLFFRTIPSDTFQANLLAQKVHQRGIRTMAVIHQDNVYAQGLLATFRTRFGELGGTVVSAVSFPPNKTSGFEPEVQRLFAAGVPEGVLIVGVVEDTAPITRAIALADPRPRPAFFGVDGNYKADLLLNGDPAVLEGMSGTAPSSPEGSPLYQAFLERFHRAAGIAPSSYSALAYDAVYLAALALAAGGENTPLAVRRHLRAVSGGEASGGTPVHPDEWARAVAILRAGGRVDYEGAYGKVDFDAHGDVTSASYLWWQIQNGRFVTLEVTDVP